MQRPIYNNNLDYYNHKINFLAKSLNSILLIEEVAQIFFKTYVLKKVTTFYQNKYLVCILTGRWSTKLRRWCYRWRRIHRFVWYWQCGCLSVWQGILFISNDMKFTLQGSQYQFHQVAKMYQQAATFLVDYHHICAQETHTSFKNWITNKKNLLCTWSVVDVVFKLQWWFQAIVAVFTKSLPSQLITTIQVNKNMFLFVYSILEACMGFLCTYVMRNGFQYYISFIFADQKTDTKICFQQAI